jgi:hypothetical protein
MPFVCLCCYVAVPGYSELSEPQGVTRKFVTNSSTVSWAAYRTAGVWTRVAGGVRPTVGVWWETPNCAKLRPQSIKKTTQRPSDVAAPSVQKDSKSKNKIKTIIKVASWEILVCNVILLFEIELSCWAAYEDISSQSAQQYMLHVSIRCTMLTQAAAEASVNYT